MSITLMAKCWPLQMPPTPKAVLMSLADNANDEGHCWPSLTTICERTCLGRTAVIEAIKWLERSDLLVADRSNGRHTAYQLHAKAPVNQSAKRTGTADGPVRDADGTSPPGGRDQSGRRTGPVRQADSNRQGTVNEPSRNQKKEPRKRATPPAGGSVDRPAEVSEGHWRDWLAVRAAKKAGAVTGTALAGVRREAEKAGIPLDDAVRICAEKAWIGFNASWDWQPKSAQPRASPWQSAADARDAEMGRFLGNLTGGLAGTKPNRTTFDADEFDAPAVRRIA